MSIQETLYINIILVPRPRVFVVVVVVVVVFGLHSV